MSHRHAKTRFCSNHGINSSVCSIINSLSRVYTGMLQLCVSSNHTFQPLSAFPNYIGYSNRAYLLVVRRLYLTTVHHHHHRHHHIWYIGLNASKTIPLHHSVSEQQRSIRSTQARFELLIQTQALAFLAVFVYATQATHATQAIAFEWKPGVTAVLM